MHSSLITSLLRCPICGSDFVQQTDNLHCKNSHSFLCRGGIIDFSVYDTTDKIQERTKDSFEVEWNKYYPKLGWTSSELPGETDMFLTYTKALPSFFSGKIVIDAGCGNGRYINIVNKISVPPPRLIIGIELSDNVFLAADNCSIYNNVLFIKMDLNSLQRILKEPVDYIYSIGVLHHTPNAEQGFYNLAKCVRSGGFLSLFLYGKGNSILYKVNSFLRNHFFQKWSHKLVFYLCVLIAIPCQLFRVKFFGPWMLDFINRFVFVSPNVHNMFDAYTAGYTSFHERKEVEQWYRNVGFDFVVEERLNRTSLFCIGMRIPIS